MDRRQLLTVTVGALVAVLLVAVATAGEVPLAQRAPSISWEPGPIELPELPEAPVDTVAPSEPAEQGRDPIPPLLTTLLKLLFYGSAVVVALVIARALWQRRPRVVWKPKETDEFEVLDDIAASIAADAAEQRAVLMSGAPRNAIVECWLRLERLVTDHGFDRDPSDTSAELAARVLGQFEIDPPAIVELAALYREARFSTHELDESTRARAIVALDAVHDGMRRRTPPVSSTP